MTLLSRLASWLHSRIVYRSAVVTESTDAYATTFHLTPKKDAPLKCHLCGRSACYPYVPLQTEPPHHPLCPVRLLAQRVR